MYITHPIPCLMPARLRLVVFFISFGFLLGCHSPVEPVGGGEEAAASRSSAGSISAVVSTERGSSGGARINVPGCQNDDGTTDIILPDGAFRVGVPIISSNCVLGAGPTEHLTVHSELPDDVAAPTQPVVWNYENTRATCWANNNDEKHTTDWQQRITPSGQVDLSCHFNAKKKHDS